MSATPSAGQPDDDAEVTCKNCRGEIWWVEEEDGGPAWFSLGDDVCGIADENGVVTWDLSIDHAPIDYDAGQLDGGSA